MHPANKKKVPNMSGIFHASSSPRVYVFAGWLKPIMWHIWQLCEITVVVSTIQSDYKPSASEKERARRENRQKVHLMLEGRIGD